MFGKESGVLAGKPTQVSHQYCSNGTIEVEVAGSKAAGVADACVIPADGVFDDAKWAAWSRKHGQHEFNK